MFLWRKKKKLCIEKKATICILHLPGLDCVLVQSGLSRCISILLLCTINSDTCTLLLKYFSSVNCVKALVEALSNDKLERFPPNAYVACHVYLDRDLQ